MTEDESTEAMQTYAAGLSILDMRPIRTPEVDWPQLVLALLMHRDRSGQIGRASCRERVSSPV